MTDHDDTQLSDEKKMIRFLKTGSFNEQFILNLWCEDTEAELWNGGRGRSRGGAGSEGCPIVGWGPWL